MTDRPRHHLAALVLLGSMVALAGCETPSFMSFPPQLRGNKVDADQLKELIPGTTSRADVQSLLGSPTTKATFDDNTWIYIMEVTRPVIAGTQAVEDQHVVVLVFDDNGVLRKIDQKTQGDSMPVSVVSRTTPSPGNDISILQELLGNVGKFNPGTGGLGGSGLSTTGGGQGSGSP